MPRHWPNTALKILVAYQRRFSVLTGCCAVVSYPAQMFYERFTTWKLSILAHASLTNDVQTRSVRREFKFEKVKRLT